MDGKAHIVAGSVSGIVVANYTGVDLQTGIVFTILGGCVGLVPDLDVNGTLANKLSLNKKWLIHGLGLFGLLLLTYSFGFPTGENNWMGIVIGSSLLMIPSIIVKQRMMLTLTGMIISAAGFYVGATWLILFGIYISIASQLPHRSLTHSLIGLGYFAFVGHYLEADLGIEGLMLVCNISYASHLLLDMKWLPGNRRGVKLLQPISKIEL